MRILREPPYSAIEVFETCISKVRNLDLKDRYTECLPDIAKASEAYKELANKALLHTYEDKLCLIRRISIDEMKAVYTQRMAHQNGPGYKIYNKIKKATFNRTCPICGQRKVSTLDHVLPKSEYPSLVVAPINLIPACHECNKLKSSKIAKSSLEETLHPYFDDLGMERFLFAEVVEENIPWVNFFIEPPNSWNDLLAARVKHHFKSFKLNELYRIHSVDEIIGQIEYWSLLNENSLREHLVEQASSRKKAHVNSWQTAFYEGVAKSDWFCKGGFLEIGEPEDLI
ncbi:HNH endonuclease [Sporosarcina sp. 179-K 3D1 HS]|uniref:HNH endonuclease n=1 Tax=Sporosarcina sp. 179-K 3D1 HS TaxID=3232169 RepID=UPI0039A2A5F5